MKILNLKEIPDTIPTLAKWHHEEWAYLNPQKSLEKRIESYREYLGEALVPSTYVALEKSTVLGSASIIKHDMDTRVEYSPWLASVFVHPDHRERGVGSKLVSHVMSTAKKSGFESLYLFTPDRESFYKRLGWTTIHREPYNATQVTIMILNFT
jgi:N-acetylglutamate synthase-like GNAT family acetyltransferase